METSTEQCSPLQEGHSIPNHQHITNAICGICHVSMTVVTIARTTAVTFIVLFAFYATTTITNEIWNRFMERPIAIEKRFEIRSASS